jgi:hypothetical protein
MATLTKPQLDELGELLERRRELNAGANELDNLRSSLFRAHKALDGAAEQAAESIGRVGLDMLIDDLTTIEDMTLANARRLREERLEVEKRIDLLTAKGHQPVVDSMPVWSIHGTHRSRCLVCGEEVTINGKWDEVRDRPGIRHYTRRER